MSDFVVILFVVIFMLVSSIVAHWKIRNIFLASITATVFATAAVFVTDYLAAGYVDPFWSIALPNTLAFYFITALVIGIPFAVKRRKQYNKSLKERDGAKSRAAPRLSSTVRLQMFRLFKKKVGKKFNIGDRVVVSSEGGWKEDYDGIVVGKVGISGLQKTRMGMMYMYWVEFECDAYDTDNDGPYDKAQILSIYLSNAT